MADSTGEMLCRALDLERKALDFYTDAQERCSSQLARKVFGVLAEDKLRLARRLAEIHAALNKGISLDGACRLIEEETLPPDVFAELKAEYSGVVTDCREELDVLLLAMKVEQACLSFLEDQLREAKDEDVRFFLERAMEEERGHFILLSDMRYYFERFAESSPGM
ncbi:MAG: ferritin family protein [Acidobacteriota bacterium]